MDSFHLVTPTTSDWEALERRVGYVGFFGEFHDNVLAGWPRTKTELPPFNPRGRQSSLGELGGLVVPTPQREEIHSVGTTPAEKGNEVPTLPTEEARSTGVKPRETAAGETLSEEDSREEQPAAETAALQAVPEDDACDGKTLEATLETNPREKTPEGSEPEEIPTEESGPELAEMAQLVGESSRNEVAEKDHDEEDDNTTESLTPPVLAGPSTDSRKRSRSPSPFQRDAQSTVEHEAPAMSDESPGPAKRQRLHEDASSSSPAQTRGHPAAAATTSSPSARKRQRAIEINDSPDSHENEPKVVFAQKVKTVPGNGLKRDSHHIDDEPSLECGPDIYKLPELEESPPTKTAQNTKAPREIVPWSAAKRYHSSANSFPDYGPLDPRREARIQQEPRHMKTKPASRGSFHPVNRLSANNNRTQDRQSRSTASHYDLHGESYRRPAHNHNKKQKVHGPWSGGDRSSQEIIDLESGSRDGGESSMSQRRRGTNPAANNGLAGENPVQEYSNVEEMMSPRSKRGRGRNTNNNEQQAESQADAQTGRGRNRHRVESPKRLPAWRWHSPSRNSSDQFDPISDGEINKVRGPEKTTPQVVLKGYDSSSYDLPPPKSNMARSKPTRDNHSDGSVDDLSAEHYSAPLLSSPDKRSRSKYFPAGAQKDTAQAQSTIDTSDDEVSTLEKGNIKPTEFAPSRKANAKETRYDVLQLLTNAHTYLPGGGREQWTLVYDIGNDSISIEGKGAPSLSMPVNRITGVDHNMDSSKIIVRKSRESSFSEATTICLTLGSSTQSMSLTKQIASNRTIKPQSRPSDFLDRVFDKTLKTANDASNRQSGREEPNDVQSSKAKTQATFDRALESKQASRGPRLVDQMAGATIEPCQQPHAAAPPMKTRSSINRKEPSVVHDLTSDDDEPSTPAPDNKQSHSPSRVPEQASTSRRNSFAGHQWSLSNPGWEQSWKRAVTYPRQGKNKATVIIDDIGRLDEGQFLNDNLMEFYMRWLEHHAVQANPGLEKRVLLLNSFFYSSLTKTNAGQRRGINYEAVRRWTTKVNLLAYDYIVVPVNENAHWYVAIICNAPKLVPNTGASDPEGAESSQSQVDSQRNQRAATPDLVEVTSDLPSSPSTKKGKKKTSPYFPRNKSDAPRIITLDSLGGKHSPTCTNLKEYLVAEIKAKTGIDIPPPGSIGMTATDIPEQDNFSDCGLFVLNYIDRFLQRPDEFIQGLIQHTIDLSPDWPKASDTRNKIRDILFTLQEEQTAELEKAEKAKAGNTKGSDAEVTTTSSSESTAESSSPSNSDQSATETVRPKSTIRQSIEGEEVRTTELLGRKQRTAPKVISNLESKTFKSCESTERATSPMGQKPTRERKPTPFPTSPNTNDLDDVDTQESRRTSMQVAGSDDDEMLFTSEPTKKPARTPSPQLLSDPSFISSHSSAEQPEPKITSSPTTRSRKPKSPTAVVRPPLAYPMDAADKAIIGKQGRKKPHM